MTVSYDLHIHSCLSPCGEMEMTPNNMIGMAAVLELPVIAVSDHNTTKNLPACAEVAKEAGILLVPGMEITTAEEVHVLSLFPDVKAALEAGDEVYSHLPNIQNRPDIFGEQIIMDGKDRPVGSLDKLLINATDLSIEKVFDLVFRYGGIPIPAHIDKSSNSILSNLGFIPPELNVRLVEVSRPPFAPADIYRVISDSDAHALETMANHSACTLEMETLTVEGVLSALR